LKLTAIAATILLLQVAPIQSQQRPIPKGSIEGIVVRVGTNEPIAGTRVTLSRSDAVTSSPQPATVGTDAGGVFVFRELDAGSYRMEAARNGYVRQEYGQRIFNGPGTPIALGPGQVLKDLAIRLTPSGSIEGRVTDSAGNPFVGIPVELLRRTFDANGQRILHLSGSTRTNDRGEYRLYWITPGRYYVNAGSTKGSIGLARTSGNSPNEIGENYEAAYYPGVTDVSQASIVEVRPGDQVSAIDVTVGRQRMHRIRGRVIDARTGRFPSTPNISISYLSPTGLNATLYPDVSESYDSTTGVFELRDISPGSYVLGAAVPEKPSDPEAGLDLEATVLAPVTISDSDVENVILTVPPAVSLPGRLKIEGQSLSAVPGAARIRVQLEASINGVVMPSVPASQPQFQWANSDGTFILSNLPPGEYRVRVAGLPPDYYVKDARLGQSDVFNEPMHFSGSASSPLDVALSPNGGRIDGTIVNDKQEPMRGTEAVLIPDRQRDRTDLYKTATSDQSGHFAIRGIPPGDYKVFAWDAIEEFAYYDPDLVRLFEQKGAPVRILESSKETLEVKIIPAVGR